MLLDNPEKAAKIAQNGYDFVQKHFNWDTETDKINKLINKRVGED
jgi:glycosyltransferase involved in cell wall biosynthesis